MTATERMKRLTVLMLVDPGNLTRGGRRLTHDHTDRHLLRALRRLAKRVALVRYDGVDSLTASLSRERPDVVFNLTEWVEGDRMKDVHICALLDLHGVPYTGPGPKGLMLCRDKSISKLIAQQAGFAVPRTFVVEGRSASPLPFPLVVKPRFSDASDGISQASLVSTNAALHRRAALLRRQGFDSILAEEYAGGRELLVSMIGERIVSVRELFIERDGPGKPLIFSSVIKHDRKYRRRWAIRMDHADLTPAQNRQLAGMSRRTAAALELRDYGRLDVKFTPSGEFVFLEANPNPALVPPRNAFSGSWAGIDYDDLVTEITLRAWRRKA